MPRAFSSALCDLVKADLQNGIRDLKTLQTNHKISSTKARAMRSRFLANGEVINTNRKKPTGRRRKLNREHEESLLRFLNEHPDSYLKDMCKFMEDTYQLQMTESTLQRTCVRIGWKLKKPLKPRDEQGFWIRTLPRDENGNPVKSTTQGPKRPAELGKKLTYPARRHLLEKTRTWVKEFMSQPQFDGSHDYNHILRVAAMSLDILRAEQNAHRDIMYDTLAIELAALMHDVDDQKYRHPANGNSSNHTTPGSVTDPQRVGSNDPSFLSNLQLGASCFPEHLDTSLLPLQLPTSPPTVEDHLLRIGWPPYVTSKVNAITPWVSYRAETNDPDAFASALALHPELAIVQDADRIDAMGAIGIGRAFTYGGAKGREEGMAGTIDHFRDKLVNLESKMKTEEGKRLAFVRSQRLKIFGRWWQEEMGLARAETGDMAWVQEVPPWVENAVFKEARPGEGSIPVHASGSRLPPSGVIPPNQAQLPDHQEYLAGNSEHSSNNRI